MNIFEIATKQKIRFASLKGDVTTEMLWDIPLESKSGFDLDTIAKSVKADLDAASEESFVRTSSPMKTSLELKLLVVKHVIDVRLTERAAALRKKEISQTKQTLLDALARKQTQEIDELSAAQIQEKLAALE